ncbi:MAG: tetratricopeptide repeat protein [Chitinophagaceae bacterium]|nr:MAG: tetratricopeptide repeat protein [Chitinophagaceae bacterium]
MTKTVVCAIALLCFFFGNAQNSDLDSLLIELKKAKPDTGKVNLLAAISRQVRFTDPQKAIQYGKQGYDLSKQLGFDKGTAACYLNVSTAYNYRGAVDTALTYLDTALSYAHKAKDYKRLGLAYLNRGDTYRQMEDFKQALLDCDTALYYADKVNDDDVRARVNQTFGSIYYHQQLYPQSVEYSNKAMELYRKTGNMRMCASVYNNLGLIYKEMKNYGKATQSALESLRITDSLKDLTNLSIFATNIADIYFLSKDYTKAIYYVDKAAEYAQRQNNDWILASAWSMKGHIFTDQKKYTEAIPWLIKAQPIFEKLESVAELQTNADMLAESYAGTGDFTKAYGYMRLSKKAGDTIALQKYNTDIATLQTKFKVDEKDKEIQLLAKDKEIQKQRLREKNIYMIASVAVAMLALMGIWLAINRNRLRQRMKELELRNQIAADLHDEVGSSLSSIHMLSQMASCKADVSDGQKNILNKVSSNAKETMDKMSDIVWMIKPGETQATDLAERMERFAKDICSSRNIDLSLDIEAFENVKLSMDQRKNIYLIFKEAVNNAVKYADTKKLTIHTSLNNRQLSMHIKDYGKGFSEEGLAKGNGLANMKNRARESGGELHINSTEGNGTSIVLTLRV